MLINDIQESFQNGFSERYMLEISIIIKEELQSKYPIIFSNLVSYVSTYSKQIEFIFPTDGNILLRVPAIYQFGDNAFRMFAIESINIPDEYQRKGITTLLINTIENIVKSEVTLDGILVQRVFTEKMFGLVKKLNYTCDHSINLQPDKPFWKSQNFFRMK